jgi:hypothetical protein
MGKRGAKAWEPNWDVFNALVATQCTLAEIAAYFAVSEDTIERTVKRDKKVKFAEYFRQKRIAGNVAIRRSLYKKAVGGDMTAIIFWFKVHLNYTDKMKITNESKTDKQQAEAAKEFVTRIETLVGELKQAQPTEDKEKRMGLLAASLGIRE